MKSALDLITVAEELVSRVSFKVLSRLIEKDEYRDEILAACLKVQAEKEKKC